MNTHTLNGSQRSKLKQILILEFDQKCIVLESQTAGGMHGGDVEGEGRRGEVVGEVKAIEKEHERKEGREKGATLKMLWLTSREERNQRKRERERKKDREREREQCMNCCRQIERDRERAKGER